MILPSHLCPGETKDDNVSECGGDGSAKALSRLEGWGGQRQRSRFSGSLAEGGPGTWKPWAVEVPQLWRGFWHDQICIFLKFCLFK